MISGVTVDDSLSPEVAGDRRCTPVSPMPKGDDDHLPRCEDPNRQPVTCPGGDVERRAAVFKRALDVVVCLDQWPAEQAHLAAERVAASVSWAPDAAAIGKNSG